MGAYEDYQKKSGLFAQPAKPAEMPPVQEKPWYQKVAEKIGRIILPESIEKKIGIAPEAAKPAVPAATVAPAPAVPAYEQYQKKEGLFSATQPKPTEVTAQKPVTSVYDQYKSSAGMFSETKPAPIAPPVDITPTDTGFDVALKTFMARKDYGEILKDQINKPVVKGAISMFAETTRNLPAKAVLRAYGTLKGRGEDEYLNAYKQFQRVAGDPASPTFNKFLNQVQNTIPQTALGVLLAVGTTALTKNPAIGQTVAGAYWSALSADEQIQEKGKVESLGNIAIDTVGDSILGNYIGGFLKQPAGVLKKTIARKLGDIARGGTIEGGTEVLQTLLKNANDYKNAKSAEERAAVVDKTKKYVTSGDILMEFGVGAVAGGAVSAAAGAALGDQTANVEPQMAGAGQAPEKPVIATPEGKITPPEEDKVLPSPPSLENYTITEKTIAPLVKEMLADYKRTGIDLMGRGTKFANAALVQLNDLADYPQVQKETKKDLDSYIEKKEIKPNEDGTITVWRAGDKINEDRLVSVTYDRAYIDTFIERYGDREINEYTIKPEDVKYVIGGGEKELLVPNKAIAPETATPAAETRLKTESVPEKPKTIKDVAKETPPAKKESLKITHFTKSENINAILSKGFDTTLPPIHGTGGLEGGAKTGKAGGEVLYFTTDNDRWKTATVFVGKGKGTISRNVFNYDTQKWEEEKNAYAKISLSSIEASVKDNAKILTIDSIKKAQEVLGTTGRIDQYTTIQDFIDAGRERGYDIVHIENKGGKSWQYPDGYTTKMGDEDWYNALTGNSGKSDYFVLNKDVLELPKPVAAEKTKPEKKEIKPPKVKINTGFIEKAEQEIRDLYTGAEGAQEKLENIREEMEISEAGYRYSVAKPDSMDREYKGSASTFPSWIPDDLHEMDLFKKVFGKLDKIETIGFPVANRIRQRALYDSVMARLDEVTGVDTSEARRAILRIYGDTTAGEVKEQEDGHIRVEGGDGNREITAEDLNFGYQERVGGGAQAGAFNPNRGVEFNAPAKSIAEYEKTIKRSEIAKQLSEKFGVPIRRGKFRFGKAIGLFKSDVKVIRYKAGGLPTIFHEIGHFVDDKYHFSNYFLGRGKNITERKALVQEYGNGNPYEGEPRRQAKEALAEFVRFYYTGEREKALEFAPSFYALWETRMEQLPEIRDSFDQASSDYMRWIDMPSVAKVKSQISFEGDGDGRSFAEKTVDKWHRLYEMAIDDLHPLEAFVKKAKQVGAKFNAEEDPYVLARLTRGWTSKAETFLEKGTFGKKFWSEESGKIVPKYTGKGLREILKPLEDKGSMEDFSIYLVAKRAIELSARDIKTGMRPADAAMAVKDLEAKYSEFPAAMREVFAYQDNLLKYGLESGLYDADFLAKIRQANQFYVPFFRVMEELESKGYMGKGFGNVQNGIKKIKGSDRDIINPLESIVKNTYAIINAAERNSVMVAMARLAQQNSELGRMFEKVAAPQQATKVNVKEVLEAALGKTGEGKAVLKHLPQELEEMMVNIFRPSFNAKGNSITVLINGKPQFYEVDPDLYRAVQALDIEQIGMIGKILSYPAKFLRAGATLTPDFILRNPARDQITAAIYSKYGFIPGVDLMRGVWSLVGKDEDYWLWRMGGGEHAAMVSLDRDYLQSTLEKVVEKRGAQALKDEPLMTALKMVKNPLKGMQILSELGEAGTRLGEMKKGLKRLKNPLEAAFASREVTLDFARIGSKTRAFNAITAFWNANVQGNDKMIRDFKRNPYATTFKAMAYITLPSILLYAANRRDPRWKEIPEWQKDLFWIVFTDNHIIRIPKPFVIGQIFGSLPERMLEYMDNENPQIFESLYENIANGVFPGIMPTVALPIIENITNHSFFLDRQIVPDSRENLPPEAQFGDYTSELSKEAGRIVGYSPAKIDNLIRGYFAGLGDYSVKAIDGILAGTGITNPIPRPTKRLEDLPVIKAFMIAEPIGSRSQSLNEFYDEANKAEAAGRYYAELIKKGEKDAAMEFRAKNPVTDVSTYYAAVKDQLSAMSALKRGIMESRVIQPSDKRDRIEKIDRLMTQVSERALRIRFKQ